MKRKVNKTSSLSSLYNVTDAITVHRRLLQSEGKTPAACMARSPSLPHGSRRRDGPLMSSVEICCRRREAKVELLNKRNEDITMQHVSKCLARLLERCNFLPYGNDGDEEETVELYLLSAI